jgi:cytochrome P450
MTELSAPRTAPGPDKWQLRNFGRDPVGLVSDMQRTYGGITRLKFGPLVVHLLTDPDHVKHVLQDNARNYERGRLYKNFNLFFGRGMLTTDGDEWKGRRKVSQPFFHRQRLHAKSPVITECAEDLASEWESRAERGELIDVTEGMMRLAMGVFSRMFLGTDLRSRSDEIQPAVLFASEAVVHSGILRQLVPKWSPTRHQRTQRRYQRTLDGVMNDIVEQHIRGEITEETVVTALLAARDEQGRPWPRETVLAEMKTMFLAGHETSGCALIWTLYSMAQNPALRRRLEDELGEVLGGRTPTVDDLPNLPYLRQVVDESLRLHPPIWAYPRDAVADDVIGGYHIPAGSSILVSPFATQHNSELWETPEAYDPERFCPAHRENRPREKYAYFPFGGGARKCIGFEVALIEIQLTIATLAQRLRLDLIPGRPVGFFPKASLRPTPSLVMAGSRIKHPEVTA